MINANAHTTRSVDGAKVQAGMIRNGDDPPDRQAEQGDTRYAFVGYERGAIRIARTFERVDLQCVDLRRICQA